jgi:hypothetical protein
MPQGFFPLEIGRVFELTFSLFRFRFTTMAGLALVTLLPATLISLATAALTTQQPAWLTDLTLRPGLVPTQAMLNDLIAYIASTLLLSLALSVIGGFISQIGLGALVDAVARIYAGRPASVGSSLRRALRRWITLLAVLLLMVLGQMAVVLVGLLALVVVVVGVGLLLQSTGLATFMGLVVGVAMVAALIFVLIRWSMAVNAVMLERLGATAALGRSWRLIAGSTWRVLGYFLAFGLLAGVIAGIVGAILGVVINPYEMSGFRIVGIDWARFAIFGVLSAIVGAVLLPITTIPTILLYFDLRFRRGERMNAPGLGSLTADAANEGSVAEE